METSTPVVIAFNPLQRYLDTYQLGPLDVALKSGVRYSTVWNILHDKPVISIHAAKVRYGLKQLTGVDYTAPIRLLAQKENAHHD